MATSRIDGRAFLAGLTTLALIGSLFLVLRAPAALAEEQHNDVYPSVPCGTGDTREEAWHWVHNQVPDGVTSAILTASFEILTGPDTGSTIQLQVVGEIGPSVIHYDLYYPYGLKLLPKPSDDVDGGMLVLSHWPECAYSSTTTSTTHATSTSTTKPSTTSTTDGYTTTTEATTTTSVGSTSTSTTEATTTTSVGSTSTSTTEATTTSTTEATTTSTTEATTTSTTEATTTSTTEAPTTTTLPDEVDDSEVTTTTEPDEVSPTVLPFTGIDSDSIFLIALILISTGVLTVVFVRGTKEWGES